MKNLVDFPLVARILSLKTYYIYIYIYTAVNLVSQLNIHIEDLDKIKLKRLQFYLYR